MWLKLNAHFNCMSMCTCVISMRIVGGTSGSMVMRRDTGMPRPLCTEHPPFGKVELHACRGHVVFPENRLDGGLQLCFDDQDR